MLNARLNRQPMMRSARVVTVIALLGITVPIAGFGASAQTAFATVSGAVADPFGGVVPDVTLVLSNVQSKAKHEVYSDQAGRFEFVGLPAGDYLLEARLPGFATLHDKLTLAGQNLQRSITLELGSIQETVTVTDRDVPRIAVSVDVRDRRPSQPGDDPCSRSPVGGCIQPPMKLRDVKPHYPRHLHDARIEGLVVMEGSIGTDGFLTGLRVVAPVDPGFANAAIEAVSQWQFEPTRLDGVLIETRINVSVNFRL